MRRFADNEVFVTIDENVRGEDVFVIQSTCYPANDNLMELLICIDALQRASARRITAVIPYFGYARQDRKTGGRTPISAKLVANLITRAGADRVLTLDLHAGQIQGFFDIPTDNLRGHPGAGAHDIRRDLPRQTEGLMIVSPDVGGVVRACALADRLNADLAIVDKRRPRRRRERSDEHHRRRRRPPLHPVRRHRRSGRHPLQRRQGPGRRAAPIEVSAYVTPRGAVGRGAASGSTASVLTELVITDTIEPSETVSNCKKVRPVSVAPLIGEAIRRIANEESVSKLFD